MSQTVFEQLSKEMAVFAQNNFRDYTKIQKFFLYELELRCVSKSELREIIRKITEEKEPEDCGVIK